MKKIRNSVTCPWCGRDLTIPGHGVAPRHKRVTGTDSHGTVQRGWCPGSGELPLQLSAEARRQLRTLWRDDGGELIADTQDR